MGHDRRFRFGVMCGDLNDGVRYLEIARRAEALGYSTLLAPDHFVDHPIAPIPALAAAAAVTTTLRVGTLVLGNDYRHPVVLATEAAAIDQLSQGRFELGLGAGWMTLDYERAGLQLDPPGVRIARLEESITILQALFADEPVNFAGRYYTVTDLVGEPRPCTPGGPPLTIGGGGPKILGLAARHATTVGINANLRGGTPGSAASNLGPGATDQKLGWLRDAAGDHFADLEVQTLTGFVHRDDTDSIVTAMADAFSVTPEEARHSPAVLLGTEAEMVEELEWRRDRWQMSYPVIPFETMEDFAPVVARLSGT